MPYKKGSRTMPPVKTPQLLQRCVAGVAERFAAKQGGEPTREDVSRAFAICTAQGQRYGKYEPGTRTLTPRGKGLTTAVRRDKRKDLERYETVLQEARDDIRAPSGAAITGFDLFDVEESTPTGVEKARRDIEKKLGGSPRIIALNTYVKPEGREGLDGAVLFWWNKAWAVISNARTESEALRVGRKIQRSLVAPRNISASDPYVHTLPLYVIYGDGQWLMMPPMQRKASGMAARMSDASWWCPACRVRAGMSPVDLRRGHSGSISRMSNTSWWCPACQTKQIARPMAPVYGASGAISGPRVAAIAIGSAVIGAAATYWLKKQGG